MWFSFPTATTAQASGKLSQKQLILHHVDRTTVYLTSRAWHQHLCVYHMYTSANTQSNAYVPGFPPVRVLLMIKESRGKDKRVAHLQAALEGCIKMWYYGTACCRVSSAGVDTEMCYLRQSLWYGRRKGGAESPWCIRGTLKDIQYHTHT